MDDDIDDTPDEPMDDDTRAALESVREEALDLLAQFHDEDSMWCAHCGRIPDGVLIVRIDSPNPTERIVREDRICAACARTVLRWL